MSCTSCREKMRKQVLRLRSSTFGGLTSLRMTNKKRGHVTTLKRGASPKHLPPKPAPMGFQR